MADAEWACEIDGDNIKYVPFPNAMERHANLIAATTAELVEIGRASYRADSLSNDPWPTPDAILAAVAAMIAHAKYPAPTPSKSPW